MFLLSEKSSQEHHYSVSRGPFFVSLQHLGSVVTCPTIDFDPIASFIISTFMVSFGSVAQSRILILRPLTQLH